MLAIAVPGVVAARLLVRAAATRAPPGAQRQSRRRAAGFAAQGPPSCRISAALLATGLSAGGHARVADRHRRQNPSSPSHGYCSSTTWAATVPPNCFRTPPDVSSTQLVRNMDQRCVGVAVVTARERWRRRCRGRDPNAQRDSHVFADTKIGTVAKKRIGVKVDPTGRAVYNSANTGQGRRCRGGAATAS